MALFELAWCQLGSVIWGSRDRGVLFLTVKTAPLGPSTLGAVTRCEASALTANTNNTVRPSSVSEPLSGFVFTAPPSFAAHVPTLAACGLEGKGDVLPVAQAGGELSAYSGSYDRLELPQCSPRL